MYRVRVISHGPPGSRYCFTQKAVLRLVEVFLKAGAEAEEDFIVEKFYRISHGVFAWSSLDENNPKFSAKYSALIEAFEEDNETCTKEE